MPRRAGQKLILGDMLRFHWPDGREFDVLFIKQKHKDPVAGTDSCYSIVNIKTMTVVASYFYMAKPTLEELKKQLLYWEQEKYKKVQIEVVRNISEIL